MEYMLTYLSVGIIFAILHFIYWKKIYPQHYVDWFKGDCQEEKAIFFLLFTFSWPVTLCWDLSREITKRLKL